MNKDLISFILFFSFFVLVDANADSPENELKNPMLVTTEWLAEKLNDPEIIIVAFAYNGGEGGTVAAPIVARVMQAYFELKSINAQ